jgi:hypothetical protein
LDEEGLLDERRFFDEGRLFWMKGGFLKWGSFG